ncbi:hypothetical protein ACO0LD_30700 [Undibacterium sp. Ji83W]|uniref:hypothetical protein n=1 Tax=Undibacterium sp. Ji83W TaxID=3413043 RepID=UPI003BF33591
MQYFVGRFAIVLLLGAPFTSAFAQNDRDFRELMRVLHFAEINRGKLESTCRENPQFSVNSRLIDLCAKRNLIPDTVIEDAALPYLKHYLSTELAREAIAAYKLEPEKALSQKLRAGIASGKADELTQEELLMLKRRNASRHGLALSAFALDRERGMAVARAMFEYEPDAVSTANEQATTTKK